MAYTKNIFGGLDMDSSPRNQDGKRYFKLYNGEVVGDEVLDTGAINNIKGNEAKQEFLSVPACPGGSYQQNLIIIGAYEIDNYMVYFTVSEDAPDPELGTSTQGQIWRVKYDENNDTEENELIFHGFLDFYKDRPVMATGRVIDENNIKVYFVDGYNKLRHINIMDPENINNDEDYLDIIGSANLSEPYASISEGGYYKAGSVQYAYQLINYNGAETTFSNSGNIYHISNDPTDGSIGNEYKGTLSQASNEDNTGKGFRVTIDGIDDSFSFVRVVAIHYDDYNGSPEIRVIAEESTNGESFSTFDDGNINLGSFSLAEFAAVGLLSFSPSCLTNSSNRLVVANVKLDEFIFDYDARAYRYDENREAKLWNKAGTEAYTISYATGVAVITDPLGSVLDGFYDIPEDWDCIISDKDVYKYKSDGGTIGGAGENIDYEMKLLPITIDSTDSAEAIIPAGDVDWKTLIDNDDYFKQTSGYSNFASEAVASQFKGYKRKENYRFGLVGFDLDNKPSYVKWIGDIVMPKMGDTTASVTWTQGTNNNKDFTLTYTDGSDIKGLQLYLNFRVQSLPEEVIKYQIVREERTLNDRSIVSQGMVGLTSKDQSGNVAPTNSLVSTKVLGTAPFFDYDSHLLDNRSGSIPHLGVHEYQSVSDIRNADQGGLSLELPLYKKILNLWSPDISYDNLANYNGDLDIIGAYDFMNPLTTTGRIRERRYKSTNFRHMETELNTTPIETDIIGKRWSPKKVAANDKYKHSMDITLHPDNTKEPRCMAYHGKAMVLSYSNQEDSIYNAGTGLKSEITDMFTDMNLAHSSILMGEIKLDLESQYSGEGFASRIGRKYIPASKPVTNDPSRSEVFSIFGGDTFIGMYEFIRHIAVARGAQHDYRFDNTTDNEDKQTMVSIVRVPVESFINVDARAHQNYDSLPTNNDAEDRILVQETAGYSWIKLGTDDPIEFSQETGFYSYNTAYSRPNNSKFYVSESLYYDKISYSQPSNIYISSSSVELSSSDNWLKFLSENSVNVNGNYGPVSSIHDFRDRLLYVQTKGIGHIGLDPQAIIPSSESELVLGTGNMFTKPSYISTNHGTKYKFGAAVSDQGLYVIDELNKSIIFVNGSALDMSRLKGINSYLKEKISDMVIYDDLSGIVNSVFVNKHNIYFNIYGNNEVVKYNEVMQSFENTVSKDNMYMNTSYKNRLIDIDNDRKGLIWFDGYGSYGTYFLDTARPLTIEFIVNEGDLVKVFDLIEYNANPLSDNLIEVSILDDEIGDFVDLDPKANVKFKKTRVSLPRKYVGGSKVGRRYLGDYAHIRLSFSNLNNTPFVLRDLITHFRIIPMPFN